MERTGSSEHPRNKTKSPTLFHRDHELLSAFLFELCYYNDNDDDDDDDDNAT